MTRITIELAPLEGGLHRDAYEALISDLAEQGFDAEIREPVETRGDVPDALVNAALWLGDNAGEVAVGLIAKTYIDRMRKSRRGRRRQSLRKPVAVIYGPDGEELRTVEIPEREK